MAPKTATKNTKDGVTRKAATRAMKSIRKKPAACNPGKKEQEKKKKDKQPRQLKTSHDFNLMVGPGVTSDSPLWQLAVSVANFMQGNLE